MKIRAINDNWYGKIIGNAEILKSRPPTMTEAFKEINIETNDSESGFNRCEFFQDRDEFDSDAFGYTVLQNCQIACFDSGGEKLLCLPQVLELFADVGHNKIRATIEKLGIILIECNISKLEILHQNQVLQSKTTRCGLISQSNAERLSKIFRSPEFKSSENLAKTFYIPLKYRHQIRVVHDCFGQQKGILMPQLCTNNDAQCIECFDCGVWFSPSEFVGHTHNSGGLESEMSTCHWGFISSNWRLYLRLAEDPSRTTEEERSLNDYLTEIKNRFTQPIYDSLTIYNDHDQQTPSDNCSFNTSPSMPTPTSLSPTDGYNKIDLHNSSSMFQQCIMRICNNHLENSDDRNQLINTLFMLRQEHHQQISTLISERQELIKALKKSPVANHSQWRTLELDEEKITTTQENSSDLTLLSIKDKIAILKRSNAVKRKYSSETENLNQRNEKERKTINPKEMEFIEPELPSGDNNHSMKEIIDCDSSSIRGELSQIFSSDQRQEMKND